MLRIHKSLPGRLRVFAYIFPCLLPLPACALDLLQSYQAALEQDATFNVSRAATEASREVLPQARAQLLPSVSFSTSKYKNSLDSETLVFPGKTQTGHSNYDSSQWTISLRQPLFRMYQYAQYEQAKSQVESAEANLDKDRQSLGVRVSEAYFEALLAQGQLALILSQKTAYDAQLQGAKRSLSAGVGTRTDIDEAQAKYDMVSAQEIEASQNTKYTRRQLQAIVNQPVEYLVPLDAERLELAPPAPAKLDDWIIVGYAVNPELRSLKAQIEAAREETEKAKSGHYPTLDFVAQRDRSSSQNVTSINNTYLTSQFGLQATIPIFAGGYNNSMIRQARANLEKVQQQYEEAKRRLEVQIQKEFQNVTEGILKVRALEQAKRSAEQALYSTQKGMQAGTRTQIDVLNAEQQKVNTILNLGQSRYMYIVARIRLLALTGSLGVNEMLKINSWLSENSNTSVAMQKN